MVKQTPYYSRTLHRGLFQRGQFYNCRTPTQLQLDQITIRLVRSQNFRSKFLANKYLLNNVAADCISQLDWTAANMVLLFTQTNYNTTNPEHALETLC